MQRKTSAVLLMDLPKTSPGHGDAVARLDATAILCQPELVVQE